MTVLDYLQQASVWDVMIIGVGIVYPLIFDVVRQLLSLFGWTLNNQTVTQIVAWIGAAPVSFVAVWIVTKVAPEFADVGVADVWNIWQALAVAFLGTLTYQRFKEKGRLSASTAPVKNIAARINDWQQRKAA